MKNKEELRIYNKEYKARNKEKISSYNKEYKRNNLSKRNEKLKEKRLNDPLFKLTENLKCSIRKIILRKGFSKKSKTKDILGCSYEEFKIYIEDKFESWMNWNNHGVYTGNYNETWQLDHIIPISLAKNEKEAMELSHYTNFQPLCSKKNQIEKSARLNFSN